METNKITYQHIEQYLQGTLDEKSMHILEKQALEDPLLAEALEGYAHTKAPAAHQLSLLQKQLEERITAQQEERRAFHFSWQRISVAAAACLLFISASILFWMKGSRNSDSQSSERRVDVTLMPPDSLATYTSKKKQMQNEVPASPVGGWQQFEKYLKENKKTITSSVEAEVILAFKVAPAGGPVNIRIIQGQNEELNKEAIRLLQQGPRWEYLGQQEVRLKIDFRK